MKLLTEVEIKNIINSIYGKDAANILFNVRQTGKRIAQAQLAQDQKALDEAVEKLKKDIVKILDDNYKDRVDLWEKLKEYCEERK